jgi:tetratricopeptide (TPR) repeat protein
VTGAYLGFPYQRDPVQATAAWQALVDRGDSSAAMANLATMLLNHRDYAHAEPLFRASIRRHPDAVSRVNFVAVLFNQGKVREADSVFTSARAATPAFALIPQWAAELAYQRGDLHTLARIADSARTSTMPMQQTWGAYRLASLALLRGQVASYERYMREGRAVERARQTPVPAVIDSIVFAYREAWMSPEPASALARLDAALARQPLDTSIDADSHYLAAITYAMGGRVDRARAVLANYDAGAALDTVERRLDAPGRHRVLAEIALAEKRWPRAIAELRLSDSTTAGLPAGVCRICVYAPLGRAFDRAGVADSAIAFYEQYLQSPYFMRGSLQRVGALGGGDAFWAPAVVRRLGQLYEARGDRVRAADQYARFVALWNEADPEFQPLVSAARARLAQLKVEGR